MGDNTLDGGFPLDELRQFKDDLKKDIDDKLDSFKSILDTGIKSIFDLFSQYTKTNDRDHQDLKDELIHLRSNDRDLYEKLTAASEKTDEKITSVRLDLEHNISGNKKEIDKLKLKPGENASKLLSKVGGYIIVLLVGMGIVAIFWAVSQGNIPLP